MAPGVDELTDRVTRLLEQRERVVIGIAGAPGAGKSTLAEAVVAEAQRRGIAAVLVPMDGYHLADSALAALGRLTRKGAIDTFDAAGYAAVLDRIRCGGEAVWVPAFERTLEQPIAGSIAVSPEIRVVVTEGNYLLMPDGPWSRVRELLDEAWYVEVDDAERVRRLVERHVRFGKAPAAAAAWVAEVDEPNARLIAGTRARADLVVAGG